VERLSAHFFFIFSILFCSLCFIFCYSYE